MKVILLTTHRYFDFLKVKRENNIILLIAKPLFLPGMSINEHLGKGNIVPLYDIVDLHLTYPMDGSVHQTLKLYNQGKIVKAVKEDQDKKEYKMKSFANDKSKVEIYKWDREFPERVFFRAGGTKGLPISEYKTTDW